MFLYVLIRLARAHVPLSLGILGERWDRAGKGEAGRIAPARDVVRRLPRLRRWDGADTEFADHYRWLNGALARIRTPDHPLTGRLLYQTELHGQLVAPKRETCAALSPPVTVRFCMPCGPRQTVCGSNCPSDALSRETLGAMPRLLRCPAPALCHLRSGGQMAQCASCPSPLPLSGRKVNRNFQISNG